jgi:hypothetical protein
VLLSAVAAQPVGAQGPPSVRSGRRRAEARWLARRASEAVGAVRRPAGRRQQHEQQRCRHQVPVQGQALEQPMAQALAPVVRPCAATQLIGQRTVVGLDEIEHLRVLVQ